jgi:outer membrane protein
MARHIYLLFFLLIAGALPAAAQDTLTLEQAIQTALKNNYSIIVARNETEIAKNNNSPGNAGFLPRVDLNLSTNSANNTTHQIFSNAPEVNRSGVRSQNLNSGLVLQWTLFDGGRMFVSYKKLKEIEDLSQLNARLAVENIVARVIAGYYNITRQGQLQKAAKEALSIHEERVRIAETRYNIGSGSKLEFLQAKVDYNAQKAILLRAEIAFANAKTELGLLLAKPSATDFNVTDSIVVSYLPKYEELKTSILKRNTQLLIAEKNIPIAKLTVKEWQSFYLPSVGFIASYNFNKTENAAGFTLLNQNRGFNTGFTATWNLFNGFNTRREAGNAKLAQLNSETRFNETLNVVESGLLIAWRDFQSKLQLVAMEEENYLLAKENVNVALERFRLGSSNTLELKEAQRSFEDAQARMVSARYDAKLAETELMRLNGELVK